jgi:hypothetical protein
MRLCDADLSGNCHRVRLLLAPEGGVALEGYPSVGRRIARIKALPGYAGMPGL